MSDYQTAVETWLIERFGEENVDANVHLPDLNRYIDFVVDVSASGDENVGRNPYVIEAETRYDGVAMSVAQTRVVANYLGGEPIIVTTPEVVDENAPEVDELRDAVRIVEFAADSA